MKKLLIFLFSFLALMCSTGVFVFTGYANNLTRVNKFMLDGNNISFTLSQVWEEEITTDHDLSLTKLNANLKLSVYKKEEVQLEPEKFMNDLIKEELKESDSKELKKKFNVNRTKNKTIYSKLYKASKDNVENEYLLSIIEFDNSDTYLYAVYTAKGAYMQYSIEDIQRLLLKMEYTGKERKTELAYN